MAIAHNDSVPCPCEHWSLPVGHQSCQLDHNWASHEGWVPILWSKATGKQSSLPLANKSKIQAANWGDTWIPTPACCQCLLQTRTQSNPSPGGRFHRPSGALRWAWLYLVRIKVRFHVPVVRPNSRGSVCQGPHSWPPYRGKIVIEHLVVGSLLSFPKVVNVSIMTEPWLLTENDLI